MGKAPKAFLDLFRYERVKLNVLGFSHCPPQRGNAPKAFLGRCLATLTVKVNKVERFRVFPLGLSIGKAPKAFLGQFLYGFRG